MSNTMLLSALISEEQQIAWIEEFMQTEEFTTMFYKFVQQKISSEVQINVEKIEKE